MICQTKTWLLFCLTSVLCLTISGQRASEDLIRDLLLSSEEGFDEFLKAPEDYRLQVLYTQIDRDSMGVPSFRSFRYGTGKETYFYPASSIKIFAAALALEKLNLLDRKGLTKYSTVHIDSSHAGQQAVSRDSTSDSGQPYIAHYLKKMLVISDNDAFNRLYEFIGQGPFNEELVSKGYKDTRILHRLSIDLSPEANRHTNAMTFYDEDTGEKIFRQEAQYCEEDHSQAKAVWLGSKHVKGDEIVPGPMNFESKNRTSLEDLQKALQTILFPDSVPEEERFALDPDDYELLYRYMSQLPRETNRPDYGDKPDNYCKFLIYGDRQESRIPEHIRIFNKIGLAYGFTVDNAYVADFENKIEFLLSAVLYTNENQTLNDGIYEYDSVAFPFFGKLGRMFYAYELKRNRRYRPDLERFRLNYEQ